MAEIFKNWLIELGAGETFALYLGWAIQVVVVIVVAFLSNFVAKRILITGVRFFVKRSRTRWDDALYERNVFVRMSHLAPAIVV